jgi:hypothetical protein
VVEQATQQLVLTLVGLAVVMAHQAVVEVEVEVLLLVPLLDRHLVVVAEMV